MLGRKSKREKRESILDKKPIRVACPESWEMMEHGESRAEWGATYDEVSKS